MSDHVYKSVEVTGSSTQGIDDAVRTAVAKASQSLRHLEWFEVVGVRGHLDEGQVAHFQVTVKRGNFISARCHDADHRLNIKAKFIYTDGQSDSVGSSQTCTVG